MINLFLSYLFLMLRFEKQNTYQTTLKLAVSSMTFLESLGMFLKKPLLKKWASARKKYINGILSFFLLS